MLYFHDFDNEDDYKKDERDNGFSLTSSYYHSDERPKDRENRKRDDDNFSMIGSYYHH